MAPVGLARSPATELGPSGPVTKLDPLYGPPPVHPSCPLVSLFAQLL
jgi:hypothetical protein